jgi:hypothetical protein
MNQTLKAGKYYLGDPIFALNEETYDEKYGNIYNYQNGKYDLLDNKTDFVVHKTHYGDGIYEDTKNRKYNITTGLIGLVHESMIDNFSIAKKNGVIFHFLNMVHFIYNGGLFTIKSGNFIIEINTQIEEEYDSQDEEEHLYENGKISVFRNEEYTSDIEGSCDELSDNEEDQTKKKPKFKNFFKK